MTGSDASVSFRLAYVPGVIPAKWVRVWGERLPDVPLTLVPAPAADVCDVLRASGADAGLVRLPVDRTFFSAIPLYTETTVVVVPKDHLLTVADEVRLEDLADETVLHPLDDVLGWDRPPGEPAFERPATTADAVELVAAGIGVLVVPQSLARLHHRRDLTYRPVVDAPQSDVALAWPQEATTDLVEEFIGIVRGRTVNSTRGRPRPQAQTQAQEKRPDAASAARGAAAGRAGRGAGGRQRGGAAGSGRGRGAGGSGRGRGAGRARPRRRS
ncbi:LysR family substrate-binding domain-containing protein [Streptomyces echinoruber]|uniref:LysR family substrate-binding domain-containing protein n=1 Tax=Streptomyces echinoruber TaxID=68898 RepID=UPI00167CA0AD|nr:LysR family substrate-binding domain-containing protein [Streptomyces echinoruber]